MQLGQGRPLTPSHSIEVLIMFNSNIPHELQAGLGFRPHIGDSDHGGIPQSVFIVAIPNGTFGDCLADAYNLSSPFVGYWIDPETDIVYCERSYAITDSRIAFELAKGGEQISVLVISGASRDCYILNLSDWIDPECGFIYAAQTDSIGKWTRVDSVSGLQGYTRIGEDVYTAI
jgi:hypothetical protein